MVAVSPNQIIVIVLCWVTNGYKRKCKTSSAVYSILSRGEREIACLLIVHCSTNRKKSENFTSVGANIHVPKQWILQPIQ